jgi:hypothetical protein
MDLPGMGGLSGKRFWLAVLMPMNSFALPAAHWRPSMTNLSPAALTVIAAYNKETRPEPHHQCEAIAAALRAAADQVVPDNANPVGDEHDDARLFQWMRIRWQLLAIAAELEALDD